MPWRESSLHPARFSTTRKLIDSKRHGSQAGRERPATGWLLARYVCESFFIAGKLRQGLLDNSRGEFAEKYCPLRIAVSRPGLMRRKAVSQYGESGCAIRSEPWQRLDLASLTIYDGIDATNADPVGASRPSGQPSGIMHSSAWEEFSVGRLPPTTRACESAKLI